MKNTGFTLVELLVVIAIIGILSTVAVVNLDSARHKARVAKSQADLHNIARAFDLLAHDTGKWPGTGHATQFPNYAYYVCSGGPNGNEVRDLRVDTAGLTSDHPSLPDYYPDWDGPYMTADNLIDPWGNPYFFDNDYWCTNNSICNTS
jgi:prepilin-type N-terminal cleavage/methylation domain-containing protein